MNFRKSIEELTVHYLDKYGCRHAADLADTLCDVKYELDGALTVGALLRLGRAYRCSSINQAERLIEDWLDYAEELGPFDSCPAEAAGQPL